MAIFDSRFETKKSSFSPRFGNKSDDLSIEALSRQFGIEPPKPKVGALTRLGNVLSAFEIGGEVKTFLETGDVKKAGKQYVSETARGLGSLFPFLDEYTKPKELSDTREGFKEVANILGVPEKGPWDDLLGIAGDIVLDPGNILLAPLFKTAVKGVKGVGGVSAEIISKTSKGEDLIKAGEDFYKSLARIFIPDYLDLPPEMIKKYKGAKQLYQDMVKYHKFEALAEGRKVAQSLPDEESFIKVVDWIESGGKTNIDEELLPVAKKIKNTFLEIKKEEKAAGILKKEIEDYYPHIRTDLGDAKVPFPKPLLKKLKFAKNRKIAGTVSEINEAFGKNFFETNPAMALTIRRMASKKALNTRDFLQSIEEMFAVAGKEPQIIDGVKYVPFKPEGALRFFPMTTETGSKVAGVTKKVKQYLLPEEIVNNLEQFNRTFNNDASMSSALKLFDKVQNMWKKSVTVYFPGFHARNAFSNVFVNWLADVNDPKYYKQAIDIVNGKTGKIADKSYDEILDLAKRTGVLNQGFFTDLEEGLKTSVYQEGFVKRLLGLGGKVGVGVENNARLAHFINKLEKGMGPQEAAQSVKKFLFDYNDLTLFEKDVMRRIFPFYTWTRKAIPLMVEQTYKKPRKIKAVFDLTHNLQTGNLDPEEEKYIPDYIKRTFGINIGRDLEGDPMFLASLGLPLDILGDAANPLIMGEEMLTPLAKFPLERATGINFFTQKQIKEDPFLTKTTKLWTRFPVVKDFLKAEEVNGGYYVDPARMHILKSAFGRVISTGEKLTEDDEKMIIRLINAFSGGKIYEVDIESAKYFQDRDLLEEMTQELRKTGKVKKFEKFYIPKD